MRCPTLAELPPPPDGKHGWPWTIESRQLDTTMADGKPWPRISIVTPSYNQGQFIEETIRSVLLQGYPNLEYIIIDGGSTDGAVDIIRKYEPWLTYWVTGPDGGQSAAINEGFRRATGVIGNWLNSDDYLNIGALATLANAVSLAPNAGIYTGGRVIVNESECPISVQLQWMTQWVEYRFGMPDFPQDASFFKIGLLNEVGGVSKNLKYMMDVDFYRKLLRQRVSVCCVPFLFSTLRLHPEMKTISSDPRRLEELHLYHNHTSVDWRKRAFLFSRRLRLHFVLARMLKRDAVVPCFVVRYDGWKGRWISYELRP